MSDHEHTAEHTPASMHLLTVAANTVAASIPPSLTEAPLCDYFHIRSSPSCVMDQLSNPYSEIRRACNSLEKVLILAPSPHRSPLSVILLTATTDHIHSEAFGNCKHPDLAAGCSRVVRGKQNPCTGGGRLLGRCQGEGDFGDRSDGEFEGRPRRVQGDNRRPWVAVKSIREAIMGYHRVGTCYRVAGGVRAPCTCTCVIS